MQISIKNNVAVRFGIRFLALFIVLYFFNIFYFGLTLPGGHFVPFLADHLNYIAWLRWALLKCSSALLNAFGFTAITDDTHLLAAGHGRIQLVYTCLGLGVMSFFSAFVLSYPKKLKAKILFLLGGLISIQVINIIRLSLLVLFWDRSKNRIIDHHTLFDIIIYILITIALYRWINNKATDIHA